MHINSDRLWQNLMEMAKIGAITNDGVCRLALSEKDKQGRELFTQWCLDAGMSIRVDAIGNLFARREGAEPNLPAVVLGSHLDTQPEGGRFDGVYGVLAGLEVVSALNDQNIQTKRAIEVVSWTNEEGARFTPAMLGSSVYTGLFDLNETLQNTDDDGVSIAQALDEMGYETLCAVPPSEWPFAYLEAHIEQGPILENANIDIGVVTGGQAIGWLDVTLTGFAAHAGTTPMLLRKDALFAATEMWANMEMMAKDFAPHGNITIGKVDISHPSRNTIVGKLNFTIDIRHHDDAELEKMIQRIEVIISEVSQKREIQSEVSIYWKSPATPFDEKYIEAVNQAAINLNYSHQKIISGAGHDAILLAKVCPTTMIFIPCLNGVSHNPSEFASKEHVAQGANVLLHVAHQAANL